jgi:3-isopropylmalate dehydratase small subunit
MCHHNYDYKNYFHYQNINECFNYLKLYADIYTGNCLKILYAINEDIKAEHYKIFGKVFFENNKDKLLLTINGKKSELVETVKINNNDKLLEVILFQKSINGEVCSIKDISYMFCYCKSKSIEIKKVDNREILQ